MATKTAKLSLVKPDLKDMADISVINDNMDVLDSVISSHTSNKSNPHKVTAEQVGADTKGSAASALTDAKDYTDTSIANLINGAPTTLDTLSEIATAMSENEDVVAALESAIGTKANTTHTHSASNITSGTLAVGRGGTGVTSNPSMLVNLASTTAASVFAASPRPGVTGTLPITSGGTGANTARAAQYQLLSDLNDTTSTALTDTSKFVFKYNTPSTTNGAVFMKSATAVRDYILSGITTEELGFLDGATSNIQTQLNGKAASSHGHSVATSSAAGFMSAEDKAKLDSIATGATNASLTSLGITATAAELNYVDGVKSNIQAQLDGKAASSHTHDYLPLSGGTMTGKIIISDATGIYNGDSKVILGYNNTITTGTSVGDSVSETVIRSSGSTDLYHKVGSTTTLYPILDSNNFSTYAAAKSHTHSEYAAASHTHSYVPTTRTVNGKALSANITLSASDIGAAASSHTHDYAASSHTHSYLPLSGGTVTGTVSANVFSGNAIRYSSTEPTSNLAAGQIWFKPV